MLDDTLAFLPSGFRDPTRVSNVSTADLKKKKRVAHLGTIPGWTLCGFFVRGDVGRLPSGRLPGGYPPQVYR